MTWARRIRSWHRWISLVFTFAVIANFALMPLGDDALSTTVGGLTAIPLLLLLGTGAYLFVLPYVSRQKGTEAT